MTSTSRDFEPIDGKKYLMHGLPGAPICEFLRWKEGSLILVLRVVSVGLDPLGRVTTRQLQLLAGSHLTMNPTKDFEVENCEWKLVNKETGYGEIWNKFDYYRREIADKWQGISSVEGFIGEWSVEVGNIDSLLRKLNANRVDKHSDYREVRTCPDIRETPVNPGIPEPCNRCEYSHLDDIYGDGRLIPWCADGRDEYWGDPECPYIKEIQEDD